MRKTGTVLLLTIMAGTTLKAQAPTLDDVLTATARYVSTYQERLAGVVAEELYRQQVIVTSRSRQHRQLRSDVLMVMPRGGGGWLQFRDVFEVDGQLVRDRDERLSKMFVESQESDWQRQIQGIQVESARYNLGPLERTINIPIMALQFFDSSRRTRIRFKHVNDAVPKSLHELAQPGDIWVVEFEETGPGALVRDEHGRDLLSTGRAWIDIRTGRVLRTEHVSRAAAVRAQIVVTYRAEASIDVLVPAEMLESYALVNRNTTITGRATYNKFRRFTVTTSEKPKP